MSCLTLLSTALLTAVATATIASADDKPLKGDLAKLQGKWIAQVGINKDENLVWEIEGEKLTQKGKTGQGEDYTTTSDLILDETSDPKHLDQANLTVEIGDKGKINQESTPLCIYKIEGEKLIICSGSFGGERPESFEDREKGGEPIVLERVKDGAAKKRNE